MRKKRITDMERAIDVGLRKVDFARGQHSAHFQIAFYTQPRAVDRRDPAATQIDCSGNRILQLYVAKSGIVQLQNRQDRVTQIEPSIDIRSAYNDTLVGEL